MSSVFSAVIPDMKSYTPKGGYNSILDTIASPNEYYSDVLEDGSCPNEAGMHPAQLPGFRV